VSPIKAA